MKKLPCYSLLTFAILATIAITACENLPVASFTLSNTTAEVGDTVYFLNTSQDADDFNWDFGDGNVSTEKNPTHVYTAAGTFYIQLVVSNEDGSDEANSYISITPPSGKVIAVTVHSPGLEGNLLGDSPDRSVSIYLPPGYESSGKNYPVIYLLSGFVSGDDNRFGPNNPNNPIPTIMNRLIYYGTIEPMILVSPDSKNRFKGSFYLNSIVSGNWQDYIVCDVVQFVDNTYRTIPNSESRGIGGHSMGGYGAVMIAMKYPEIFSTVCTNAAWPLVIRHGTEMWNDDWKNDFIAIAACNNLADFETLHHNAQTWVAASVAMVPNPSASPFYFNPVFNVNGQLVDSVLQRYDSCDPSKLVPYYKENLLQLKAIQLENGIDDECTGCYDGNVHFANLLQSIGIGNPFKPYDGRHSDKLFERLESSGLPFFSDHLVHEN